MNQDFFDGAAAMIEVLKETIAEHRSNIDRLKGFMYNAGVKDNDLSGVLNASANVLDGLQVAFETAAMRRMNSERAKPKPVGAYETGDEGLERAAKHFEEGPHASVRSREVVAANLRMLKRTP